MEREKLGDTVSDAQPLVNTLADLRKKWSTHWLGRKKRWSRELRRHTKICAATGRIDGRLPKAVVNKLVKSQAEVEQRR